MRRPTELSGEGRPSGPSLRLVPVFGVSTAASSSCVRRAPSSDHCSASSFATTGVGYRSRASRASRASSYASSFLTDDADDEAFSAAAAARSAALAAALAALAARASASRDCAVSSEEARVALSFVFARSLSSFSDDTETLATTSSSFSAESFARLFSRFPTVSAKTPSSNATSSFVSPSRRSVSSADSARSPASRSNASRASTRDAATSLASMPATDPDSFAARSADALADRTSRDRASVARATSRLSRRDSATPLPNTARSRLIAPTPLSTAASTVREVRVAVNRTASFAAADATSAAETSDAVFRRAHSVSSRASSKVSAAKRRASASRLARAPYATRGSAAMSATSAVSCRRSAARPPPAAPKVALSSSISSHGAAGGLSARDASSRRTASSSPSRSAATASAAAASARVHQPAYAPAGGGGAESLGSPESRRGSSADARTTTRRRPWVARSGRPPKGTGTARPRREPAARERAGRPDGACARNAGAHADDAAGTTIVGTPPTCNDGRNCHRAPKSSLFPTKPVPDVSQAACWRSARPRAWTPGAAHDRRAASSSGDVARSRRGFPPGGPRVPAGFPRRRPRLGWLARRGDETDSQRPPPPTRSDPI